MLFYNSLIFIKSYYQSQEHQPRTRYTYTHSISLLFSYNVLACDDYCLQKHPRMLSYRKERAQPNQTETKNSHARKYTACARQLDLVDTRELNPACLSPSIHAVVYTEKRARTMKSD